MARGRLAVVHPRSGAGVMVNFTVACGVAAVALAVFGISGLLAVLSNIAWVLMGGLALLLVASLLWRKGQ
jgi:hypothetical protein